MDFMDNSNHMCLICNQTIIGLLNYVEHFKTHATPQESHLVEQKISSDDIKCVLASCGRADGTNSHNKSLHSDQHKKPDQSSQESGTYSGDTSPMSEFIDNSDDFNDTDLGTDALLSPKHCPDFFQSLELKSANEETAPKPKLKAVQRLSILEDDVHAESLLPITNILSNLEFTSDENFSGVSDNDGERSQDDNFWLSDESEDRPSAHPPQGHTGGKWKPGEGPKYRLPIAGKWKPGHGPGPKCRKNILKKSTKSKGGKNDAGKTFYCNVCLTYFSNRNSYSLHFSKSQHKEIAEAKKQEKTITDYLEEAENTEDKLSSQQNKQGTAPGETSQMKTKRGNDGCYCPVCNLYFDNAIVFSTHCETKLHKDAMLKRGFREYKGSDGTVFRIDVNSDVILKDKQEHIWPPLDIYRQPQANEIKEKKPEEHSCHICQKHFNRKYEMARHLLTRMHRVRAQKHPEAESVEMLNKYNKYMIRLSPFQCGVCQYYFNRQRDFLDHMGSSAHVSTCQDMLGSVVCVACKYKTHKHNEMMEHLQYPQHLAAVEKKHGISIVRESHIRITCKFCGVRMHSAVRMKRHCEQRHSDRLSEVQVTMDVKPVEYNLYNCPLCDKAFRAKSLLQLHFLKVHKHTSLFNCSECGRGFLDQRRLDNHLRTRFHAKRVVANKLKGSQCSKAADLRKVVAVEGFKRRRGRPRKGEEVNKISPLKSKPAAVTSSEPSREMNMVSSGALRRSARKRKRMRFFDVKDSDQVDEVRERKIKYIRALKSDKKLGRASTDKATYKEKMTRRRGRHKHSLFVDVNAGVKDLHADEISTTNGFDADGEKSAASPDIGIIHFKNLNGTTEVLTEDEHFKGDNDDDNGDSTSEKEVDKLDEAAINEASKHIFSCTYCEFSAIDLMELRSHYNENHPNDILMCQPCNQYFLSLKAYKIHCSGRGHQLKLREQSGETKMHKCKMCDKRFLQESCCLLHMETVHRHPSCEADLQRIHKGQDLVTQLFGDHVKQVESLSNDTSVSCPECGKFVRKDTLVEHLRLHTGERPYACRFCSKGFAGRLTLRRHISSHLNMPMFMCDLCGKEFKRNSHLIKHIRQHDFERKGEKHTCHVCKAWFYTPEELARHMRRHGDRNYKCAWPGCHWTFVLSGELKSHMFTHTGEKKYLCDMCGFGAPTKTRLRRHVKTHDKARNFTCDYCPYKATCKTHLKRHMRIHINARPFACPYCNYTCNTHENIRKHILKTQKHKGMKLYPCKLCSSFGCDSSREFRAHLMTVHSNYLRENAVDSLAVFSGLYRREEDFQKPQEGSEIIQVTKGRFFKSYQNPNAPLEAPKVKKVKKIHKMEDVKVIIVPPSELQSEDEIQAQHEEQYHHHHHQQQKTEHNSTPHQMFMNHNMQQREEDEPMEELQTVIDAPQYIEVPNMVIHSYDSRQVQQLTGATVSFASSVLQPQHIQPQAMPPPVTVTLSDDKVYWAVVPDQRPEAVPVPATTPEPWYSGMPQVHAPTSQELQQYRSVEVTTSHSSHFLPSSYFCNIPVGDIQNLQGAVSGPIYAGVVENVVVLAEAPRQSTAANL